MMLADAFQDDPFWNAVFSDATAEQSEAIYSTPLVYVLTYGEVYAPSSNLEGVAAWVPGKYSEMSNWRMLRSGAMRYGMKMGNQVVQKIQTALNFLENDHKVYMQRKSFLNLQIIGVARQHQGQGFGWMLLDVLIIEIEAENKPLYLETETEDNVRLYERFGFRVIKKVELPLINLPMWEMVREVPK